MLRAIEMGGCLSAKPVAYTFYNTEAVIAVIVYVLTGDVRNELLKSIFLGIEDQARF
jgi:hypothetical protein